jgi:hypothetical protein
MDIDLKPGGTLTITIPQIKVRIPDIKLKLWFIPIMWLKGIEIITEQTTMQLNLDAISVRAELREPSDTTKRAALDTSSTFSEKGSIVSGKEV